MSLDLSLVGMRTLDFNDEVLMRECAASLQAPTGSIAITYTAQYTNDNHLYVEVFGL